MNCDYLLITKKDFEGYVKIRESCDYGTLSQFILEAQDNDLQRVLGNAFMVDLFDALQGSDEVKAALYAPVMDGGLFTNCVDETMSSKGVKRALVHYAYAAYVMDGSYIDSVHGLVQKINDNSIPVPLGELKNLHDRHVRIASNYIQTVKDYLCANISLFPLYKGDCGGDLNRKVRGSTITYLER